MSDRPHLFCFLTRDELRLCLCVAMAAKNASSYQCYPLFEHKNPGYEDATDDWAELVRRAARYLHFEHGLKFESLIFKRDGRILSGRGPIEMGNERYVLLFKAGQFPDFTVIVPKALRFAQLKVPSLDREPIRNVKDEIEKVVAHGILNAEENGIAELAAVQKVAIESALEFLATGDVAGAEDRPVEH